ncbi:MAG: Gx transporter family protein [Cellulosilyticaceae bacterium]
MSNNTSSLKIKKLVYISLLCTLALIVYIIEMQIPPLLPIPGVRLGLANMVSLAVLLIYGPKECLSVLIMRILLGSIITGQVSALLFSLTGGLLSNLGMIGLYLCFKENISIWVLSIVGSLLHSFGQVTIAVLITKTVGVYFYLPILLISSIVTGYFVGLGAQFISKRFKQIIKK